MKDIWRIWKQEYRNIFTDVGVMLLFFGAIILYPIIYPVPYSSEVLKDIPIAVVDLSHSELSRQLIRMIDANEFVNVDKEPESLAEAQEQFYRGEVHAVVLIPQEFSKKILWGEQARVVAYTDASYILFYRQTLTGIMHSTGTLSAGIDIQRMAAKGLTTEQALAAGNPLPVVSKPLFNRSGGYATFVVPAVLILILQQILLIGIGMLGGTAREQKNNHFVISGINSKNGVRTILGKTGAYFSLFLIHTVFYFGILFRYYQFPQRAALWQLILFSLPFLLAVIFLGIALSALFRNRENSMMILLFTSVPMLFLSGFSWPPEAVPAWLRLVSFAIPSTTAIDGLLKLNLFGAAFSGVMFNWAVLWTLVLVYFLFAVVSVKKR